MCNWIRFWTAARKPPKTLYLPQLYICSNRLSNPDSPSALSKSGVFRRSRFQDSVEIPSGSLKRAPLCLAPHALLPHTPAPQTPTSRVPNTGHFSTPNPSARPQIPVQTTTHPPNPKNPPKSPFRQHPRPSTDQEMFAVPLRPPTPTRPRARPTDAQTPQRRSKNVNELASFRFYGIVKRSRAEPVRNRARKSNALKSPASDPRRSTGSPRINNVKPDPLKGLHFSSRYRRALTMCDRRYLAVGMADGTPRGPPERGDHGVAPCSEAVKR